jgi:serine/threonine protein kinase
MNSASALKLFQQIRITLKSATITVVLNTTGYLFDGLIGSSGGGKSLLYRVFEPSTCIIYCGKVYLNMGKELGCFSTSNEYEISLMIHGQTPHMNIIQIKETISFTHQSEPTQPGLLAMIMPLYTMSLADILLAFGNVHLPFDLFRNIANGLLDAGSHFQARGVSHCDFKPENIMMDNKTPIVVDFGATVKLGCKVIEYTSGYSLDADRNCVNSQFDLFCIIITLVRCFLPSFMFDLETKDDLTLFLCNIKNDPNLTNLKTYAEICLMLLESSSSHEGLIVLTKYFEN